MKTSASSRKIKRRSVSYAKWGYIFIAPFFIVYLTCSLYPQILTIYNSFFENYMNGLTQIGPNYVGLENFEKLFTPDRNGDIQVLKYAINTIIMWVMGAIPQFVVALLLAVWFTSFRLNIKGQAFFKTVVYMPNLIMASAFSMLFFTLFSNVGPVNSLLVESGILDQSFAFFDHTWSVRSLVAVMNFLMWFGNTTILLMAGIMGIDGSIFEAANIDGANSMQVFFRVTLPLLMPILLYSIITAMIGGIQMFDVPSVLTNRLGSPDRTSFTLIMYLNNYITASKNFGMGGALSVVIFLVTGLLSLYVFKVLMDQNGYNEESKRKREERKLAKREAKRV